MKTMVVIPNWNGQEWIQECLDSLLLQTVKSSIVVVDNGSVDNSTQIIEENYPTVHLIKLPRNTGFAGGVNVGIKYALNNEADAVALFNNDAIADRNWLKKLVESLKSNPKIGIATCKLLQTNKTHFDSTGECYSIWGMPFPRARNLFDNGQFDVEEYVFGASGGASLYRCAMLRVIGIFDEKYFAYYEDVDISFRAQLAGWKVWYEPKAIAYHRVGATSSKLGGFTRYHATKNFYLLYAKNMPGWLYWKYLPLFTLQAVRLCASSILKGGGVAYFKGTLRAIILVPHVMNERREIQKRRKISIRELDKKLYHRRPPKIPILS